MLIRLEAILASAMRLPLWVRIWVGGVLVPVNMLSLALVGQPWGVLIAGLAVGGMIPNLAIMWVEAGLSRLMALPHLVIWTPLVAILIWLLANHQISPGWPTILVWVILVVDVVSLGFDYPDFGRWLRGQRKIA